MLSIVIHVASALVTTAAGVFVSTRAKRRVRAAEARAAAAEARAAAAAESRPAEVVGHTRPAPGFRVGEPHPAAPAPLPAQDTFTILPHYADGEPSEPGKAEPPPEKTQESVELGRVESLSVFALPLLSI